MDYGLKTRFSLFSFSPISSGCDPAAVLRSAWGAEPGVRNHGWHRRARGAQGVLRKVQVTHVR